MQAVLRSLFPPQCAVCDAETADDFGLCSSCWADTRFITGLRCRQCSLPLHGPATGMDLCDSCLGAPRPWANGRAAMVYGGTARRAILMLKHGDRPDIAHAIAQWIAPCVADLVDQTSVIVPVPLHRTRLIHRRYNQSALIARHLGKILHRPVVHDLLIRPKRTAPMKGDLASRVAAMRDAIVPSPSRSAKDRHVMIIDDVLTSGATLSASTHAAFMGGAARVDVAVLARVAKDV